jgi:hypothetical protein
MRYRKEIIMMKELLIRRAGPIERGGDITPTQS